MSRRNRKKNQEPELQNVQETTPAENAYATMQSAEVHADQLPESVTQEPVWMEIDDHPVRHGLRVFAITMALVVTLLIAVGTGIALALVDLEKTPSDLVAAAKGSDVDAAVQAAKEEYEAIFAAAQAKVTADLSAAEIPVETIDEMPEETEKTLVASSEIAGIGEVVSAGTNDIIVYKPATDGYSGPTTTVVTDPNANYPLPFSTVDLSYFDDALFIGDSRMLGFGLYSGLNNATFYAVTSFSLFRYETMPVVQTPTGKVPIFDALPYDRFTKVYIKVGLNELGGSDSAFMQTYDEFVTKIREMEPRAIIYTHAILPVTAAKSQSDHTHSNENINARNEALKAYAEEHKCYYIDIKPVVSLPDGSLMPEMAGDGIHLKAGYMELWKEYLRTHAVIF
ncbi:MAG: hypothetical protein K6E16_09465 [Lachnospiraceae bacterium]|nr:hypothetical protein [Lachnospiraceae bacterium]